MSEMIIQHDNGVREFFLCTCSLGRRDFMIEGTQLCNTEIPIYYSKIHAINSGWIFIKDARFCDLEQNPKGAWVCPECAIEFMQKQDG